MLFEFEVGDRAYATGARASGVSDVERVFGEWPTWCQRIGLARQVTASEFEVPPLLDFCRDGSMEVWRIGLPGRFGDPGERSPRAMLPGFLRSSRRGAQAAHGVEVEPGVLEVVVSYLAMPSFLEFDPSRIPSEVFRVWVGQLLDGSDGIWDLITESHGLVVGQVGSGKSETLRVLLTQFALKGWELVIVTPKRDDPVLAGFTGDRHTVITGIDDQALEALAGMFRAARVDRTERQEIQAAYGASWWHEVPAEVRVERPHRLLVMDEIRSPMLSHRGESDHRRSLKAEILHGWNEWVQEGRSAGHHGLAVSQSPAVEGLGGGFVDDQLGFRVGVRRLSRKWHPVMFPETTSDAPSLLVNPATPAGRAVARGLVAPDTLFGAEAVNDAPMQIPFLSAEMRDGLLEGWIPWGPDAAPVSSELVSAPPSDAGTFGSGGIPTSGPGPVVAVMTGVLAAWFLMVIVLVWEVRSWFV